MAKISELTEQERDWVCSVIEGALSEEHSDQLLNLLTARLESVLDDFVPWYGKILGWLPFGPDPVDILRDKLDDLLPELIQDPLLDIIGCQDS